MFKSISAIYWGNVVNLGIAGQTDEMFVAAFIMLLFILLDALRTAVHYLIIGKTTERMFVKLRQRAFFMLTDSKQAVLERYMRSGDMAMRINGDTDRLCDIIAANFSHHSRLILQAVIGIILCIFISWQLSIAYFILLPISLWVVSIIGKPMQSQMKTARSCTGDAMSLATDIIGGALTVKSFNIQPQMNEKFKKAIDTSYQEVVKTEKLGTYMTATKYIVNVVQLMTLFLLGTWLVSNGFVNVGSVLSFVALSAYVTEAFTMIDTIIRTFKEATAISSRLYEIYDMELEASGNITEFDFTSNYVQMTDLSFTYDPSKEESILSQINLQLKNNQKLAFIGPSGCGKSTLVKLICKFYEPTDGELKLFGINIKDCDTTALRSQIALVTQDAALFDGTIYDNVAFGRLGATRDEVIKAIKDVSLWEFVKSLPDGVDTQIGEAGGSLSGGQRQRICIARALLKNARLVILDEATSALDTQTEYEIQQVLDRLMVGRCAIVVAHRLSTVQNVDYIYCLDRGRVIEHGNPKELLLAQGYYYNICKQQGLVTISKEGINEQYN